MTDYYQVLSKAIEGLSDNTGQARGEVYSRARNALITRLRGIQPALNEADITRQRLALERAIRRVEAEAYDRQRGYAPDPPEPAEAPVSDKSEAEPVSAQVAAPEKDHEAPPKLDDSATIDQAAGFEKAVEPNFSETGLSHETDSSVEDAADEPGFDEQVSKKGAGLSKHQASPDLFASEDLAKSSTPEHSTKAGQEKPFPQEPLLPKVGAAVDQLGSATNHTLSQARKLAGVAGEGQKADDEGTRQAPARRFAEARAKTLGKRSTQSPSKGLDQAISRLLVPVIGVLLILVAVLVFQYREAIRQSFGIDAPAEESATSESNPDNLIPEIVDAEEVPLPIDSITETETQETETSPPQPESTSEDLGSETLEEVSPEEAPSAEAPEEAGPSEQIDEERLLLERLKSLPAEQATLLREISEGAQPEVIAGQVLWRLDKVPELGMSDHFVEAVIDFSQAKMTGSVVIRQSTDDALSVSHTITAHLVQQEGALGGGVEEIVGLVANRADSQEVEEFHAIVSRVEAEGRQAIILGLKTSDQSRVLNANLLRDFDTLEILLLLRNGQRAIILINRGEAGDEVLNAANIFWR